MGIISKVKSVFTKKKETPTTTSSSSSGGVEWGPSGPVSIKPKTASEVVKEKFKPSRGGGGGGTSSPPVQGPVQPGTDVQTFRETGESKTLTPAENFVQNIMQPDFDEASGILGNKIVNVKGKTRVDDFYH